MSYKLTVLNNGVRLGDSFIPFAEGNTDYQQYIAWLAEGNTPEPADPLPNPRIAEIYAELSSNDVKIVRALTEGDAVRIDAHKAKQQALRTELATL